MRLRLRRVAESPPPTEALEALEQARSLNREAARYVRTSEAIAEGLEEKLKANHIRQMVQNIAGVTFRPS